jgi:translation initiation factor IF-2
VRGGGPGRRRRGPPRRGRTRPYARGPRADRQRRRGRATAPPTTGTDRPPPGPAAPLSARTGAPPRPYDPRPRRARRTGSTPGRRSWEPGSRAGSARRGPESLPGRPGVRPPRTHTRPRRTAAAAAPGTDRRRAGPAPATRLRDPPPRCRAHGHGGRLLTRTAHRPARRDPSGGRGRASGRTGPPGVRGPRPGRPGTGRG